MSTRPYKRRQSLIDTSYQVRFATRSFLTVLAVVALTTLLIATAMLWSSLDQPELRQQTTFMVALIAVATTLLIELLLALPIVFYLGFRQSHRVVGPMHHIKRTLDAIGKGDFSQRIAVRKGDVLTDLADSINQMAANLQDRSSKPSGS